MKVNLSLKMIGEWIGILLIFSVMAAVGNWVGYQYPFMESLFGMFILCFICNKLFNSEIIIIDIIKR